MAVLFPPSLPGHLVGSFSEQRQRNIAAFKPDVGAPKMRRRSTAVGVLCSASFLFTDTQLETFDEFFEGDLADGALPFEWDHPRTGIPYTWVFDPENAPQKEQVTLGATRVNCSLIRLP